jgi:hypothetical protein
MVIIKCNAHLNAKHLAELQQNLQEQANTGVIVLPWWCELLADVLPDEKIQVVQGDAPHD